MPAPRVTQSVLGSGLAAASLPLIFGSSVSPGRAGLVFVCGVRVLGAPTFTLTDSRSQSWTEVATLTLDAGLRRLSAFAAANLAEGPLTITITPSATSDLTGVALEIGSAARVSPVSRVGSASGIGLTPSVTLGMPAEQQLVCGAFTHLGVALTLDSGSGYTTVRSQPTPATGPVLHVEAQAVAVPISLAIDGTISLSATWGLLGVLVQSLAIFVPVGATTIAGGGSAYLPVPAGMA